MSIRAIVVDDEPLGRQRLERLLKNVGVDVVAVGVNGQEAIKLNAENNVDIVFLDINMPILNGIDAAKKIVCDQDQPPAIIFCTAYDEYALEAFDTSAAAYLLKPVSQADLSVAIDKAQSVSRMQLEALSAQQGAQSSSANTLVLKAGSVTENILLSEFVYFLSTDKNVYAKQIGKPPMLVDYSLKELEGLFEDDLLRIHRNCLVNKAYLQKIDRQGTSYAKVKLLHTDQEFDVSRRHLKSVKECFQ